MTGTGVIFLYMFHEGDTSGVMGPVTTLATRGVRALEMTLLLGCNGLRSEILNSESSLPSTLT